MVNTRRSFPIAINSFRKTYMIDNRDGVRYTRTGPACSRRFPISRMELNRTELPRPKKTDISFLYVNSSSFFLNVKKKKKEIDKILSRTAPTWEPVLTREGGFSRRFPYLAPLSRPFSPDPRPTPPSRQKGRTRNDRRTAQSNGRSPYQPSHHHHHAPVRSSIPDSRHARAYEVRK